MGAMFKIRSAAELVADITIRPRKLILGDWLTERSLSLVYAPSGVGKSWFALALGLGVAGGGDVFGWPVGEPVKVLYLDGEMDPADTKERLHAACGASGMSPEGQQAALANLIMWSRKDQPDGVAFPDLADGEGRGQLLAKVRELKPGLVILDNISTVATIPDENAAGSWDPFLKTLTELQQAGCAVLVVHHARKQGTGGGTYRGSQKLSVPCDTIIRLEGLEGYAGAAFRVAFEKARRQTEGRAHSTAIRLEGGQWVLERDEIGLVHEAVRLRRSLAFHEDQDIAAHLGITKPAMSVLKRQALTLGLITNNEWQTCKRNANACRDDGDDDAPGGHNPDF